MNIVESASWRQNLILAIAPVCLYEQKWDLLNDPFEKFKTASTASFLEATGKCIPGVNDLSLRNIFLQNNMLWTVRCDIVCWNRDPKYTAWGRVPKPGFTSSPASFREWLSIRRYVSTGVLYVRWEEKRKNVYKRVHEQLPTSILARHKASRHDIDADQVQNSWLMKASRRVCVAWFWNYTSGYVLWITISTNGVKTYGSERISLQKIIA